MIIMILLRALPACLALLAAASTAAAHPVPFSYLDVRLEPRGIAGTLVVHVVDVAHDLGIAPAERLLDEAVAREHGAALIDLVASRLRLEVEGTPLRPAWSAPGVIAHRQSLRLTFRAGLPAPPGHVVLEARLFPYDPVHRTFVNVYDGDALTQALLERDRARFEYFSGTRQGVAAVIARFLPAGIHHIFIGPDHLLFLVGLLLAGGRPRRLAAIVTGFTAGHSLTLSLAALDLVNPPAWIVEPAIALSIVYVGAENLLVRDGRDVRGRVALAFGLVHGFGFASVLREMDLPARALGWSLASFNVGVEIGQLAVVAVVAAAVAAVRARSRVAGHRLAFAGSVVVIVFGAFWFVERTLLAGGFR
jgi:hydrogenase/urease accessory protein HupE